MEGVCETCYKPKKRLCAFDEEKFTPLIRAAQQGHADCMEKMLQAGASVNLKFSVEHRTALMHASANGKVECVKILVKSGANVNEATQNEFGTADETALMVAAKEGRSECLKLLLTSGTNVNAVGVGGVTALHLATECCETKCMKLLIEAGAGVNMRFRDGSTALHKYCRYPDRNCVGILVEAGADVNIASYDGKTPLMVAAIGGNEKALNVIRQLGVDVNKVHRGGITALAYAVEHSHLECVKGLLDSGADVNIADDIGFTPCMHAAKKKDTNVVDMLINAGADVNAVTRRGLTAFQVATRYSRYENASLLVKAGADVNLREQLSAPILSSLISRNYNISDTAVSLLTEMIDSGADVNITSVGGKTPLMNAAENGKIQVIKLLLENGADVNKLDDKGHSAMHFLLGYYFVSVPLFKTLLDAGWDLNYPGSADILHEAHVCNNSIIQLLLEAGASVNRFRSPDETPLLPRMLEWYAKNARPEMVCNRIRLLLRHDVKINQACDAGRNALTIINSMGGMPQAEMLLYAAGEDLHRMPQYGNHNNRMLPPEEPKAKFTLKHICREAIRQRMIEVQPHSHLFGRIPLLGLPLMVNDYLLYYTTLDPQGDES